VLVCQRLRCSSAQSVGSFVSFSDQEASIPHSRTIPLVPLPGRRRGPPEGEGLDWSSANQVTRRGVGLRQLERIRTGPLSLRRTGSE
jgi:hypothetical protein